MLQLYIYYSSLTTNEEIDFVRKRLRKKENVELSVRVSQITSSNFLNIYSFSLHN